MCQSLKETKSKQAKYLDFIALLISHAESHQHEEDKEEKEEKKKKKEEEEEGRRTAKEGHD